jgi:FHA domain/Family of unknown function (DUF5684)
MVVTIVLSIIFGLGLYLFLCFVQSKICEKFGICSLFECCIPIYNMVLLCRCADISGWNVLWFILPSIFFTGNQAMLATIITIIFSVVLWGRIAERMGRGYWQYGLGCTFLMGIPILVLAFGSAHPDQARYSRPNRRNDEYLTPERVYKPLPINNPIIANIPPAEGTSGICIFCRSGELKGNTIPITKEFLTIGRDPGHCQIVLSSQDASRRHVSVTLDRSDPRSVVVTDLQSTNGTFRQVPAGSPQSFRWERIMESSVLRQGDRFRIGKDIAEFEVR